MAKKDEDKVATTSGEPVGEAVYVTETAPKLPDQNVSVDYGVPVIDQRLIDARNAEAKAIANRVNK